MIPKIIHHVWIGPLPRPVRLMETWRAMNPSFQYELWNNARVHSFDFRNAKQIGEMRSWAGKVDLMRYEILERHGGIFIDADSECVRPLDDELLQHDSFACYEQEMIRAGLISNGNLGAIQGCRLMRLLMHEAAMKSMHSGPAWRLVGPKLLTETVAKYAYTDLHVYPSHYFLPKHYSGVEYHGDGPVYAKQYWGTTRDAYNEILRTA